MFGVIMKILGVAFNWIRNRLENLFDALAALITGVLGILVMALAYLAVGLMALWALVKSSWSRVSVATSGG